MATAYYNENDPFAAAWLRELIKANLIAPGDVDERNIEDVRPSDLIGYTQCHFFAGIGGWSYALRLAGWPDDRPVWTGSCPCQPFSAAGQRKGTADERHLWPSWFHLIQEHKPVVVFGEQVEAAIKHGWLDLVSADLEGEGYRFGAAGIPAAGVGAPHIRQRLYFVADAERDAAESRRFAVEPAEGIGAESARSSVESRRRRVVDGRASFWSACDWIPCIDGKARPVEPGTFPLAHGVPARVGRLRGYGNAIVPQVAAAFIRAYCDAVI